LNPPRPKLRWEELIELSAVGDFDLLRNARQDVRQLKWADPMHREARRLYFNTVRAREEILRCNVEIRRLLTSMYDEHTDYWRAISASIVTDPPLAHELSLRWAERDGVNRCIVQRLKQISQLPGFTGDLSLGQHEGRDYSLTDGVVPPQWANELEIDRDWVDLDGTELGGNDDGIDSTAPLNDEDVAEELVSFLDRAELN
jgi:hypothetical protein